MAGVVLNLAVRFGYDMLMPDGGVELFALCCTGVSLMLLQKFHFPIHYPVPLGAAAGVALKSEPVAKILAAVL
jgi:hypothetical protein